MGVAAGPPLAVSPRFMKRTWRNRKRPAAPLAGTATATSSGTWARMYLEADHADLRIHVSGLRCEVRAAPAVDEQRGKAEVPDVRLAKNSADAERLRSRGGVEWEAVGLVRAVVRSLRRSAGIVRDVIPNDETRNPRNDETRMTNRDVPFGYGTSRLRPRLRGYPRKNWWYVASTISTTITASIHLMCLISCRLVAAAWPM